MCSARRMQCEWVFNSPDFRSVLAAALQIFEWPAYFQMGWGNRVPPLLDSTLNVNKVTGNRKFGTVHFRTLFSLLWWFSGRCKIFQWNNPFLIFKIPMSTDLVVILSKKKSVLYIMYWQGAKSLYQWPQNVFFHIQQSTPSWSLRTATPDIERFSLDHGSKKWLLCMARVNFK